MKLLIILLLLLMPVALSAGQQDVYLADLQQQIAELVYRADNGLASEKDLYILGRLVERYNEMTYQGVARSGFTSAIINREPADVVDRIDYTLGSVTFFTELLNVQGAVVRHLWFCDGVLTYTQRFPVGGSRWRVWSQKQLYKQENIVVQVWINDTLADEKTLAVR